MKTLISLLMVFMLLACGDQPATKTYVAPTNGYAQMVIVRQGAVKTLHISGQIGKGEDLESQMRDALEKIKMLLESQGGSYHDLVKINTYIVDYESKDLKVFRDVRQEVFTDQITPASTLVGVSSLALPEWLIEIDAIAVIQSE